MNDATPSTKEPATVGKSRSPDAARWWRLPLLLALVLVTVIAARSPQIRTRGRGLPVEALPAPAANVPGKTVSLTIRFRDGKEQKYEQVGWRPGMTVDDLLAAASRTENGFTYSVVGSGNQMLLAAIDEEANVGRPQRGESWIYMVNEVPADRSMGVYVLQPGDRVLWTFGRQR